MIRRATCPPRRSRPTRGPQLLTLALALLAIPGLAGAVSTPLRTADEIAVAQARIRQLLAPPATLAAPLAPGLQAPTAASPLSDATARRLAAWRLQRRLPAAAQLPLRAYFAGPQGDYDCYVSARYPLRSCFLSTDQRPLARATLEEAEQAWELEVEQMGFYPPLHGTPTAPTVGLDFFIGDTISQGADGYTAPYDDNLLSPHDDCLAYVVINEQYEPGEDLARVVRHEFNHTCQMAMDCDEGASSMEATSTWFETTVHQDDWYFYYATQDFQGHPERPIPWDGADSFFKYGASLWMRFLQEFLGDGDPALIVDLWRGSVDYLDDDNEPDLLDVALDKAAQRGLDFAALIQAFGEWRYFIGNLDDGQHWSEGYYNGLRGNEVAIASQVVLQNPELLPQRSRIALLPLAYHYLELRVDLARLDPDGQGGLWIGGERDSLQRWGLSLWLHRAGQAPALFATVFDRQRAEPLFLPAEQLQGADSLVLMLVNLDDRIDLDEVLTGRSFELVVDYRTPPQVTGIEPPLLLPGVEQQLDVLGHGFGDPTAVELVGLEGVELSDCRRIDPGRLRCRVRVAPDAAPGPRTVRVDNQPGTPGLAGELADGLRILSPDPPQAAALRPERGEAGSSLIVQVRGDNLASVVAVDFEGCPAIQVTAVRPVSDELFYLELELAAGVPPAVCSLRLHDGRQRITTLAESFSVTRARAVPEVDDGDEGGCRIASVPGRGLDSPALIGLIGLAWAALRRRRRPSELRPRMRESA